MKTNIFIKTVLTFLLMLFIETVPVFAQESHIAILLNTVNSRLNYGDLNASMAGHKKDVSGIRAGLSWQAGVSKNFSIVTEAYFARKGGALKAGNPFNGSESFVKLNTIEVPVLARLHVGKFYVNAGPYINYIFSGKTSLENETTPMSFGQSPDAFRRWEMGVQGGGGYQFNLKKKRLGLDVRYSHGLTSIQNSNHLYNRSISISVSLIKPLKRRGA